MSNVVLSRVEDRIGYVLLNRPEALNAITTELASELERALRALADDSDVIVGRSKATRSPASSN